MDSYVLQLIHMFLYSISLSPSLSHTHTKTISVSLSHTFFLSFYLKHALSLSLSISLPRPDEFLSHYIRCDTKHRVTINNYNQSKYNFISNEPREGVIIKWPLDDLFNNGHDVIISSFMAVIIIF